MRASRRGLLAWVDPRRWVPAWLLLGVAPGKVLAEVEGKGSEAWEKGHAVFHLEDVEKARREKGGPWKSFLQVPTLSTGLYVLKKGAVDGQSPHAQDEIYHVLAGKAKLEVGEGHGKESIPVRAGSVVYVKARKAHRFTEIEEDLRVLVFFAG